MDEQLLSAISKRHSTRTFLPDALPEDVVSQVSAFAQGLELPFESNTEFQFFKSAPGKGLYNNGIAPANGIALIGETDLVSISKTGFAGELVILYAASIGLSTCWFGHYKLAELGKYIDGIAEKERIKETSLGLGYGYGDQVDVGKRVICCIPFGHGDENAKRLIDRVMKKLGANRKPLGELLDENTTLSALPPDIAEVLDLARPAPSAGNSQIWRFGYNKTTNVLTIAKPIGYKHFKWEHSDVDVGICAAHVWLGLVDKGYKPKVTVEQREDRAVWVFELNQASE
ncbi:MAG: hypothetical protein LBT21_05350 [Oscillospiraceae bacterium]|jgi:nitroreductase|nr:hypothetical protein [Oscillospiraceae bacterium]